MKQEQKKKKKKRNLAKENSAIEAIAFDLVSVLLTPRKQVSQTHYKRKLAVFDLSIYSFGSKDGKLSLIHI